MAKLFKMLRNNRGMAGYVETDDSVIIAQLEEDEKAEEEGRDPVDLIAKSKKKADESDENDDDPNPDDINENPDDDEPGDGEGKPKEEPDDDPETLTDEEKEAKRISDEEAEKNKKPKDVDRDKLITEHSEETGMTYSDAKADLEKTDKIVDQFKGDVKAMAKAMRSKDREYDKLKNEKGKGTDKPAFQKLSENEFRDQCRERIEEDPDKFIDGYKRRFPNKSESMTDDSIIDEVVDREWTGYQDYATGEETKLVEGARKIKDDFISGISEADRKYLPEVKEMLERVKPHQVFSKTFDPQLLIDIAKGRTHDAEIKAVAAREYKRGKEDAKILGLKGKGGHGKPSGSGKKGSGVALNTDQKERAEAMFSFDDGYEPEKAHQMFKETYAEELKDNPRFI